jgi:hypothetical protein
VTEEHESLVDYLRAHASYVEGMGMRGDGWVLNSPHHAVMRYGRIFGSAVKLDRIFEDKKKGMCYMNALHAALRYRDLTYVEGYAYDGTIPIHHAWLVRRDGRVLDPTWGYRPDAVYVGIPFRTTWALDRVVAQDRYGLLEDIDPRRGLPKAALSRRRDGTPVPGPEIDEQIVEAGRSAVAGRAA